MSKFYWNTTLPILQEVLNRIKAEAAFAPFRLVGGTSLSLQLGHRMSDDIDLFTDHPYGSIDFDGIDKYLRGSFSYVTPQSSGPIGMGHSYMVGNSGGQAVKLDLYYTDAFVQQPIVTDGLKMATVEEIAAMKIDIVQRMARKKDFYDLHEILDKLSLRNLIELHKQRYPYSHDEDLILKNFTDFSKAEEDFDPICLKGKHWEVIRWDLVTIYEQFIESSQ